MKINLILKLGLIGLAITALNHAFIMYLLKITIIAPWAYYVVWVVFILIGIGVNFGRFSKKKKSAKKEIELSSDTEPKPEQ